jgi:hypothetical protein
VKTALAVVGAWFLALAALGAFARQADKALAYLPDDMDQAIEDLISKEGPE